MKTFFAIVAAFAFVGALAAAEEPAVKDTEVVPESIEDDAPDNQEYYGGFRGYRGGYGYGRGWGRGGYRGYGYRNWLIRFITVQLNSKNSSRLLPLPTPTTMKTSFVAITLALIYLVSFVTADHQPSTMGVSTDDSSDVSSDQADQAMTKASGVRGHTGVGLVTNTITANDNKVLVKNSNIFLSKSDRVKLAKTIQEATTMTTGDLIGLMSSMTGNQGSATSNTLGD